MILYQKETKRRLEQYLSGCVTIGLQGGPGIRRIRTDIFFGINIASSRQSEIAEQTKNPLKTAKTTLCNTEK